jgi:hypothetical protein
MADEFLTEEDEQQWRTLDHVRERRLNYQLAANQPATQQMLIDLATFCRANETCLVKDKNGAIDQTATFILEGRREVWLRIQAHLNLTSKQLFMLLTGRQFNPGETDARDDNDRDGNDNHDNDTSRYTLVSGEG